MVESCGHMTEETCQETYTQTHCVSSRQKGSLSEGKSQTLQPVWLCVEFIIWSIKLTLIISFTNHFWASVLGQTLQKQQTCSLSTSPADQPPVSPSKTTWRGLAALWALISNQMWACSCRNMSDTCVTVDSPTSWNPVWIGWHKKGFTIYFLRFSFLSSITGQLFTHQTHPVCPSSPEELL